MLQYLALAGGFISLASCVIIVYSQLYFTPAQAVTAGHLCMMMNLLYNECDLLITRNIILINSSLLVGLFVSLYVLLSYLLSLCCLSCWKISVVRIIVSAIYDMYL